MKFTFTFLLFLLASFSFLPGKITAQNKSSIEITQSSFQQMDSEQQRVLVHSWMNQSVSIVIPNEFEKAAQDFYVKEKGDENAYRKYTVVFRPLFNEALSPTDKLNFCQYLLDNFTENELPVQLIREQGFILKNKTTK